MVKGFEQNIVPGNSLVLEIVLVILLLLFIFQRFGTKIVGGSFGPFMFIWFTMLAVLGGSHLLDDLHIFRALSPYYAIELLTTYPKGFWILGAVFLCTTGAEALYSDLGHCGRSNIRISWIYVKTCLILNYLGQGAWLLSKYNGRFFNTTSGNAFYTIMPQWFLIPGIIIATAATIIASQALISGSFTLISECMRLNLWPKFRINYPTEEKGQLYIPAINLLLFLGCCGITLYFQSSSHMEAAYGLAITLCMLSTSILFANYLIEFILNLVVLFITLLWVNISHRILHFTDLFNITFILTFKNRNLFLMELLRLLAFFNMVWSSRTMKIWGLTI